MNRRLTKISKYMSFILRHHPESIGLKLGDERWADVDDFVTKANASGKSITDSQVRDVVQQNELQIFEMSEDGSRIRAK